MLRLRDYLMYAVTDDDLKINEKMAVVIGYVLCSVVKKPKYKAILRHSLRSGNWDVVGVWKMLR